MLDGAATTAEVWRDYNRRADVDKRIAELKYDLAADDFYQHEFFATEATWGGLEHHNTLFDNLGAYAWPTSPKLPFEVSS